MENSALMILIGGLAVTVCFALGGMFNLKRHDLKAMKNEDAMTAAGVRVWSSLAPSQQEELNQIDSLLVQEEWVEANVEPSILNGLSPERVLIELANRGFITLGQGVFRRHASPLDFINPAAQETETVEENPASEQPREEDTAMSEENISSEEPESPIVIITGDDCGQCKALTDKDDQK
jgi:hypothetical protein